MEQAKIHPYCNFLTLVFAVHLQLPLPVDKNISF
ncbi:unnamed protein product [Brugia timori]|uniref:Uncharacterized protein n=1 Tax=Brugia timori TaxID=42155 RepID=A0A3P7UBD5_9BILA|nr:unnamed protein product [Brugia timori]